MRSITRHFSTIKTKPIISFILGGPCCGKGTQSKLIEQHLGYKHLSAGELLRE
jgi:cytidylate kinase